MYSTTAPRYHSCIFYISHKTTRKKGFVDGWTNFSVLHLKNITAIMSRMTADVPGKHPLIYLSCSTELSLVYMYFLLLYSDFFLPDIILVKEKSHSYEGAMSRWLMLKPEADTPPREEEMVRKVTAKT